MPNVDRPFIIDIEASGFGPHGYPIEVGLALEPGEKFCSLLAPPPMWTHWDDEAEKIHRVARDILETYGRPLEDVANELNSRLQGRTVYSDGWVVDKPWLSKVFDTTGIRQDFSISALEMILCEKQMEIWHATKDELLAEMQLNRHRASYDAFVIQETFVRTREKTR
ncbi:MAG: hypothetical protein ACFHX7_16890 [Pseudomonadota bacterium]